MLFLPQIATTPANDKRRGVILLVVITMLSLFAVVGLSFVFYAESEATAARTFREAMAQSQADVDPEALLSFYLGQLLYDTEDVYSAMRGNSLVRGVYGYNTDATMPPNTTPFNGVGRLHYPVAFPAPNPTAATPRDNAVLMNHQVYSTDGLVRVPERFYKPGDPNDGKFM